MAEQKRRLNIPIYDVRASSEGDVLEDIVDAEVLEDGPSFAEWLRDRAKGGAESVAEAVRNMRASGFRDAFFTQPADQARRAAGDPDSGVDAREEARARRREQSRLRDEQNADARRTRADRVDLEREARADPLSRLRLDTARAGESYMESLRQSGLLGAGQSKEAQRQQLSGMHQIYASMMVLQCVRPLQQGLSSANVVSVLGMAASMWALSPDFRVQLGNFAAQIGDAVKAKIDGRGEKKDERARGRFEKLAALGKGDQLAARWRRRLDRIEHAERGHRLPFTAQSAAMTEVALAEAAYADIRRPGAEPRAVQDRYESALSALYEYIDDDGVDREEVSRSMRVIVGQRLEKEPQLASVFNELGHGRFTKSEPREVYINGTTETATVWTGDFIDSYESRVVSSGSFRLRPKMDTTEHRVRIAETLAAEMTSAKSPAAVNDVLSQYVVAASVGRYPEVVDELDDAGARRRFGKARTMFGSMASDGLTPDEQHFAYSTAYVDAVEIMQLVKPDLGAAWVAQYGENWREKVAEEIRRFDEMGAQAAREKSKAGDARSRTRFTPDSRGGDAFAQEPFPAEDIVDAEEVPDERPRQPRRPGTASKSGTARVRERRSIEDIAVDIELLEPDRHGASETIIDGEIVEGRELEAGSAHEEIVAGAVSAAADDEVDTDSQRGGRSDSASTKITRARVNQEYNEAETGSITGLGSDDAAPLQDVDFELG